MGYAQLRRIARRLHLISAIGGGAIVLVAQACWAPSLALASSTIHHFITGTIDYEDTTTGPVIEAVQSGTGIGLEGVTNTDAPAGAIALDGFGTSTTEASVGVNGSVDGPGSTALIGNANGTTGAASIGLEGFSANGEGVFAESTSANWAGLRSVDTNDYYDVRLSDVPDANSLTATLNTPSNGAAVEGDDAVTSAGSNDVGVLGMSDEGLSAVEGTATNTNGVIGITSYGGGPAGGFSGLYGDDAATDDTTVNAGVNALTATGTGVFAAASGADATAVEGFTSGASSVGIYGDSTAFQGVVGEGVDGVVGICMGSTGDEFEGEGTSGENYHVNCDGTASVIVHTRDGGYANPTFEQTAQAVIEDYGEARLVDGVASVRLDPAFSSVITDRTSYLVFLTPDGDTNGLFVAQKTMSGFEVREVRGGRDSLTFDYRIVGQPAQDGYGRMTAAVARSSFDPAGASHRLTNLSVEAERHFESAEAIHRRVMHELALRRHARRLPLYEPRIGLDGKLHPGQPYTPGSRN